MLGLINAVLLCMSVHETGHMLTALFYGRRLKFRFSLGRGVVPRLVWDMPEGMEAHQKVMLAYAGFWLEGQTACLFLGMGYWQVMAAYVLHLVLYPLYAGNENDFALAERVIEGV